MQNRVIIQNVYPEVDCGAHFIKRIAGERVQVKAAIFGDGHDHIRAAVSYKPSTAKKWTDSLLQQHGNDDWSGSFVVEKEGFYDYRIEAWVDHVLNWYEGFQKKYKDGQPMQVELQIGHDFLMKAADTYPAKTGKILKKAAKDLLQDDYEAAVRSVLTEDFAQMVARYPFKQHVSIYDKNLRVRVGRKKEIFSAWYEFFPRSSAKEVGKHGTFKDAERLIPRIAELGFDVIYFPPIHPVGKVNRKGKNNAVTAKEGEPGSPWAIGSDEGGHKSISPELGTLAEFKDFMREASKYGIEIAMDIAFQAAPDHPWIKEHPEWFIWRPDGTIAYAENPPKKYQDIVPINFETEDWQNLWDELTDVFIYWCKQGVRIFRVDNPHTKAFRFWEYCIEKVQKKYPDAIFLAEAFTRPKIMAKLAKLGYSQSYTYFTWRTDKKEMEEYLTELTQTELREYYRPNFWPNTPDILAYEMMYANSNQFAKRLLLAATLSSNYGLYGPAYEFMDHTPMGNGKEEYFNSEKYEIKVHDWDTRNRITDLMKQINRIRRENSALQDTYNIHFTKTSSDQLMSYIKVSQDRSNIIWCVINFDPNQTVSGFVEVPKQLLGIQGDVRLRLYDLLRNETYYWSNDWNYVEINPSRFPGHVMKLF
ncbi:MAG: alpha-1,4-glucan--maltose-1-phosphate maltosyltransferase [Bacteroidota bacterium]